MYVKDFDNNGVTEPIISCYSGGESLPLVLRDDLIKALPYLKSRFLKYSNYAGRTPQDIFGSQLKDAVFKQTETFATSLARNNGDGSFTLVPLAARGADRPVYGILAGDFDQDGKLDLLLAGNFDGVKPDLRPDERQLRPVPARRWGGKLYARPDGGERILRHGAGARHSEAQNPRRRSVYRRAQ